MKTKTKALAVSLCAILLVVASVMGTMAYLTSKTETVTNTFTVGNVQITLDEAKVNVDGKPVDKDDKVVELESAPRVDKNDYKLMPGHEYTKDPTVHFAAGSEASYLFIRVDNGISGVLDPATTIEDQIEDNRWEKLAGVECVYWMKVDATNVKKDYPVFSGFKVNSNAVGGTGTEDTKIYLGNYEGKTITVTAYAIQADGFDTAAAAWKAAEFE